ncbi:MAG: membrane dipeptidase [Pseudomonadales bacterium]|jgi:microsomal dipeptidase-like Zn-dependent dipeptidase|nr:membrane dipeptidase [Pseudomonadales bacterium]
MRIALLIVIVLAAALGIGLTLAPGIVERGMNRVVPHAPWAVSEAARTLHDTLRIADWHSDSLLWDRDLLVAGSRGHVDVPRLEHGRVTLQVFTAVTKSPAGQNYERNSADSDNITLLTVVQQWPVRTWKSLTERALHQAERLHDFAARAPDRLVVVTDRASLARALAARSDGAGPVIGVLGIEGMHALDGELANLDRLWAAGYRIFGLTHFFDNALGGSLHGTSGAGLTDFGRAVVTEIERRGGIVDLAHASPQVVEDLLAMSSRPPIISHTGLAGACATPRNIPDALMQQVAAKGGLIGIGYWDAAVCDISPAGVARSIAYGIDLLGADALSLGSDYDGATEVAFDTSELAGLTQALLDAGVDASSIRGIMGENTLAFLLAQLP